MEPNRLLRRFDGNGFLGSLQTLRLAPSCARAVFRLKQGRPSLLIRPGGHTNALVLSLNLRVVTRAPVPRHRNRNAGSILPYSVGRNLGHIQDLGRQVTKIVTKRNSTRRTPDLASDLSGLRHLTLISR